MVNITNNLSLPFDKMASGGFDVERQETVACDEGHEGTDACDVGHEETIQIMAKMDIVPKNEEHIEKMQKFFIDFKNTYCQEQESLLLLGVRIGELQEVRERLLALSERYEDPETMNGTIISLQKKVGPGKSILHLIGNSRKRTPVDELYRKMDELQSRLCKGKIRNL